MGDRRVQRVRGAGRTAASRGADTGRTAATKSAAVGRTAATKSAEIGRTAATKSADIGRTAATKSAEIRRNVARLDVPWARCRPARLVREGFLDLVLGPAIDFYTRTRFSGRDGFKKLD